MLQHVKQFQWIHVLATIGTFLLLAGQLPFIYNFFASMTKKEKAGKNPWNATTLEWLAESPPPHGNWGAELPVCEYGPYEYALDGETDFKAQGSVSVKK